VLYEKRLGDLPTLSDLPQFYNGSEQITRRSNLQAYIWRFEDEGQLWIAFNGTMNLTGLLEHIKCNRTSLFLPNHPEFRDIQAHSNFVEHFSWLQPELERDIVRTLSSRTAIRELIFVGHSSGSCAAQVAALYFGSLLLPVRPDVRVCHIGFGAPRLGSGEDLINAFNACVSEHTLITNHDDIISSLPPEKWGFMESTPFQVWLKDGGVYKKTTDCNCVSDKEVCPTQPFLFAPGWKNLKVIKDHSLSRYMKELDNCLEDLNPEDDKSSNWLYTRTTDQDSIDIFSF
jgi:hypothetical protein